jgi:hypothetical protein
MPGEQKEGVKNFICNKVLQYGKNPNLDASSKHLLTKLNITLVAVILII